MVSEIITYLTNQARPKKLNTKEVVDPSRSWKMKDQQRLWLYLCSWLSSGTCRPDWDRLYVIKQGKEVYPEIEITASKSKAKNLKRIDSGEKSCSVWKYIRKDLTYIRFDIQFAKRWEGVLEEFPKGPNSYHWSTQLQSLMVGESLVLSWHS